jgi:hypothetical protein
MPLPNIYISAGSFAAVYFPGTNILVSHVVVLPARDACASYRNIQRRQG